MKGTKGTISLRGLFIGVVVLILTVSPAFAQGGNQVFFKGGWAFLSDDRGGEVFTDAVNATGAGLNDDKSGWNVGAGVDLHLLKDPWFGNSLLGEIMLEYKLFSREKVLQTASALDAVLLGEGGVKPVTTSKVAVSVLTVLVAPKYAIDLGAVRPWIIPVGLAFQVNSPPSDDTTYLDVGAHFGVGVDYRLTDQLSLGVDFRYNINANHVNVKESDFGTSSVYVGINF